MREPGSSVPTDWPPVMDVTGIDTAGNLFRLRVSAPSGAVTPGMSADLLKAARISRYSAVTGVPRAEIPLPDGVIPMHPVP